MTSAPNGVFLSYKAEDRARVHPLVDSLEAEGISVWWDQHIGGGSNWREDIEQHLDAARCVIVVWSELTVGPKGAFVRDEASQAQEAGRYLPITIDDVRPPLGFRERQAISLVGWKGNRDDPRYRSLAEAVRTKLSSDDMHGPAAPVQKGAPVTRRAAMIGAGAAGVLALGGAGYWLVNGTIAQAKRIAILPFANMSGDSDQDYFAAGLAEELRGALARVGLEVIGRNSSEAVASEPTAEIVQKLNVSHVLTGSVRKSPQTMRIGAQLVEGQDGLEQWAQTYDRQPGDAIAIQTDIAKQVADALSIALGMMNSVITLGGTKDAQAQDYLFRADQVLRGGLSKEGLKSATALLNLAVAHDPGFALAWLKLGNVQLSYASSFSETAADAARMLREAESNTRRGIAIAPRLAYGHSALGDFEAIRQNFRASLTEIRTALSFSPNDIYSLNSALNILPWIGTIAEAGTAARRFVSLDPLRSAAHTQLSYFLSASGQTAKAITVAREALAVSPGNYSAQVQLGYALIGQGAYAEALRLLAKQPSDWVKMTQLGLIAARRGNRTEMDRQIAALELEGGDLNSFQYAQIHAQADNIDRSFAALDTAMKKEDPGLVQAMRDPFLKPLRDDPRFGALIKRLNFPVVDPGITVI